jgi:hypothetical protein
MSRTSTTRTKPWPNVCPRCHQACEVQPTTGRLLPHRDLTVNAPCPMKDKTVRDALEIVNAERLRLGLALVTQ